MASPRTHDCKWSQADLNLSLASHCPNARVSLKRTCGTVPNSGNPQNSHNIVLISLPNHSPDRGRLCFSRISAQCCPIQILNKALRNSLEPLTDTWGLNILKEPGYPWSLERYGTCSGTRGEICPGCIFLWLPAPLSTAYHWHPGDIGLEWEQEWHWVPAMWVVVLEHDGILFTPYLILQLRKEPPGRIGTEWHWRRTQASQWQVCKQGG